MQGISREAALLLAFAETAEIRMDPEKIYALLETDLDWNLFIQLTSEQGTLPMVHKKLKVLNAAVVPQNVQRRLHLQYCSTALMNFYLAQELLQLLSLFRFNQIPAIPYKGPVLAVSAYGSLTLRQFLDLDILVDACDYDRSKAVLLSQGFQLLADYGWESHFISSNGGYCLDLHRRLTPRFFPYPIEFANLWQRRGEILFCGEEVPCLSREDSLLILTIQVAKDSWANQPRLLKLCDIASYLQRNPTLDWELLLTEAGRIGALGIIFFGLRLVENLLGMALPTEISNRLKQQDSLASLVAQARDQLFMQLSDRGQESAQQAGLAEQARFHSRLRERMRDRLPYGLEPLRLFFARLFIPNARDHAFLPLPEGLYFLYYAIRPIRLAWDYIVFRLMQQVWWSKRAAAERNGTAHRQYSYFAHGSSPEPSSVEASHY